MLNEGQLVDLTIDEKWKNNTCEKCIWLDSQGFRGVLSCATMGDFVYLDNGMMTLVVKDTSINVLHCIVLHGGKSHHIVKDYSLGELGSCKVVQFPLHKIYMKTFDTSYQDDLAFAVENKVVI